MIIASEASARDLPDTTATATTSLPDSANEAENKNGMKDAKYPHDGYGGGRYGGGRGGYGGYCRCRNYYGSGCRRCCAYEGEAMEADEPQAKPRY